MNQLSPIFWKRFSPLAKVILCTGLAATRLHAQSQTSREQELMQQLQEMKQQLSATQEQLNNYHSQLEGLVQKVNSLEQELATGKTDHDAANLAQAVQQIQEEQEAQQAEIQVHEQTKVETGSHFPLKVSGMVLFNVNAIDGVVDSKNLPLLAMSRKTNAAHGSLNATMSQTLLGFHSQGPTLWGANTYGDAQVDFFSEQYVAGYGGGSGLLRLRTAEFQLAWPQTRVNAGIGRFLLSPHEANSLVTVAQPAMSWSGNLWAWIPQVTVSHDFSFDKQRKLTTEGSILDVPDSYVITTGSGVSAGERSRYPGVAARTAYGWGGERKQLIGVGGYFSRHSYGENGSLNAHAVTADWLFSLPGNLNLSGQYYHGAALAGLYAGAYKDYVPVAREYDSTTAVFRAFRDQGGWSQLAWNPTRSLAFDAAFGLDSGSSNQLRHSNYQASYSYSGLVRSQTSMANVIFRPHSSIALSLEYRLLNSWQITGGKNQAQIFGLAAGYLF